jgi:GT2 family glycosyltransferase
VLYPADEIVQAQGAFVHFAGLLRLHHAYQPIAKVTEAVEEVGGCIGACYFGRTADFTTPGGFDELMFFYFEDMEFSLRLRALGTNFVAVPDAVVDHDRGAGTVGLSFRGAGTYPRRRAYYSMRHRWLTLLIHYQWRSLLLLAPSLFVYELLNLAFLAAHGWLRDGWRAVRWLWQERHAVRQRRRRMQANRVRRDSALLVAGELPFAPGLIRSRWLNVFVRVMTSAFNLNWRMVRRFL